MITVYTMPNCPLCNKTIQELTNLEKPFETKPITEEILNIAKSKNFKTAPIVHNQETDQWWSGYNKKLITEA